MATEYFNDAWRIPNNKNQSLVSNYSMEFDGTNDSINVGLIKPFDNNVSNFAISYWIKADFSINQCHFDFRYNGATRGVALENNATVIIFYTGGNSGTYWSTPTSGLNNNEWNHIVINFDGSIAIDADKCEFWINGSKKTSTVASPGNSFSKAITGDGFLGSGFSFKLTGKLDQFCTFNYTLSASQVSTLYGGGTAVTNPMSLSPAPISYYQLGDQTASNDTTEPTPAVQSYLVPNNSLKDYVFNFDADRIDIANGSTIARQQNISYSAWINATSLSITQYIVGNNSSSNKGTSIFLLNDVLVFQFGNNTNDSYFNSKVSNLSTYVSANSWFHVAASWDGTDSKIYINGIERNSWTPTQPPTYTISGWRDNFIIGRRADSISGSFYGELSNIAFWNSGLTPTQVETIYNNGSPNDISSLSPVSWWKLNAADTFDGTNWTINDYGSGGNDGTSVSMDSSNLVVSDLQQTSGYSPYALSFDGTDQFLEVPFSNDLRLTNVDFTISFWTKPSATGRYIMLENYNLGFPGWGVFNDNGTIEFYNSSGWLITGTTVPNNVWTNIVLVGDIAASNLKVYKNGVQDSSNTSSLVTVNATSPLTIGAQRNGTGGFDYNGDLSNLSIWSGTALSSIEITEIYNSGVPSNLNTFSGTKPTAWWQFGSNSSFNASAWTCLDEMGTLNAVSSTNMAEDDITNGVGYSGNGLGTSSIEIIGDAPYSTANGISENMDVLDRTTDVPS